MLWSIVSNAFCKSVRTIPVRRTESKPFVILSWRYDKQVTVERHFLKPDWYLYMTLLSDRRFMVWSWIIRSITLQISESSEMGLKFFGSVLRPFLYKGLIFVTLHLSWKEASLMKRLQILAIGVQGIFEPALRNLPARLSTFSNSIFFLTEVHSLVILAHWRYSKFSCRVRKLLDKINCKTRKMFLKVFAIVLGENDNSFFVLRQILFKDCLIFFKKIDKGAALTKFQQDQNFQ